MKRATDNRRLRKLTRKKFNEYMRWITAAVVILFLLIFVLNLFKFNRTESIAADTIAANRQDVEAAQTGDVEEIEKQVNTLDTKDKLGSTKTAKAFYKKLFSNSVVIGDSLTEGLTVYGWLTNKEVYAQLGGSVLGAKDMFKKAAKRKPENAFLAFGMNDLIMYRKNPDGFIKEYSKRINEFKKISPKTKIYVCGISTPSKAAIKKQKSLGKYRTFNQKIIDMCEADGYTYIKISDILKNNKKLYASDGIHASSGYYPIWLRRMAEAAGMLE